MQVAAAIIMRGVAASCEVLAAQRGYGEYKGWWEFPGGKVRPGETSARACAREIREELEAKLTDIRPLVTVEYDYPDFHLSMDCFTCHLVPEEHIRLLEHEAMRWLSVHELHEVKWLPADIQVVEKLAERMLRG